MRDHGHRPRSHPSSTTAVVLKVYLRATGQDSQSSTADSMWSLCVNGQKGAPFGLAGGWGGFTPRAK